MILAVKVIFASGLCQQIPYRVILADKAMCVSRALRRPVEECYHAAHEAFHQDIGLVCDWAREMNIEGFDAHGPVIFEVIMDSKVNYINI